MIADASTAPAARAAIAGVTRRDLLIAAAGLMLAGCATDRSAGGTTATPPAARTLEHKYGTTEVSGNPERVVTVGLTEQDYVLALGVAPVGVREWFGEQPGALWPWARERLGDAPLPDVLPVDPLNYEQIAALEPDLILGINSGLTDQEYRTLSGIAPTVAQPNGYADFGAPWQEITRSVGDALGRADQAQELIPGIEARFEQARADHPQFDGATGLLAAIVEDGSYYIYAEGPAPRFLTDLGLQLPPAAAELFSGEDRPPVPISTEQLGILEADVLVLGLYGADRDTVAADPLYQQLTVARTGRDILLPQTSLANGALTFGSVLSLPVALDELLPRIAAAIDGDPATPVAPVP